MSYELVCVLYIYTLETRLNSRFNGCTLAVLDYDLGFLLFTALLYLAGYISFTIADLARTITLFSMSTCRCSIV